MGDFGRPAVLEIYTDGGNKGGVGSWAYVIARGGKCLREGSGSVRGADCNAMEIEAAIEALKSLPANSRATLFSDSRVLIDAMTRGDVRRAYQTQIEMLTRLNAHHSVEWQWVKSHNGNEFNERCDVLCILARG